MHVIERSGRAIVVALLTAVPLTTSAFADTLDVPGEYATIQAAIVAAQPGDTVLVAPGTHVETIDFLGKAITVESSGGAAVTTIDGNGGGSVVSFVTSEPLGTVLRGFTITGGTGSAGTVFGSPKVVGGGVKVLHSRATLEDCTIAANEATDYGGGLFVDKASGSASIALTRCTIDSNSTTSAFAFDSRGGGLYAYGCGVTLTDCEFSGNQTGGFGGGFAFHADISGIGGLSATDCVISDNHAGLTGGGGAVGLGANSSVTLLRCEFTGNSASQGGGFSGGGSGDGFFGMPVVFLTDCRLTSNTANSGGGAFLSNSSFAITFATSCLFADNSALTSLGGGVETKGDVHLDGCTLAGNDGSGLQVLGGATVRGCIVWGNTGGSITHTSGIQNPTWSDIEAGSAGTGNIDVDPFFVDAGSGDYHLAPTSACIDTSDPAWMPFGQDFDGDSRVLFGRVDMGADESLVPQASWTYLGHALAGAGDAPTLAGTGTLVPGSPMTLSLSGAAPNRPSYLIVGLGKLLVGFKGGVMVPTLDQLIGPIGTGGAGGFMLGANWPTTLPPGFTVILQSWISDPLGPAGFTATNGLSAETQ